MVQHKPPPLPGGEVGGRFVLEQYDEYPGKQKNIFCFDFNDIEKARMIREKRRLKALKNKSEMFPIDDIISKKINRVTPKKFNSPNKILPAHTIKESMSTKSPYVPTKMKEQMTGTLIRNTSMNFNKQ